MAELESTIPYSWFVDPLTGTEFGKMNDLKSYLKRDYNEVKKNQKPKYTIHKGEFMKSIQGIPQLPFPCNLPGSRIAGNTSWQNGISYNENIRSIDDILKLITDDGIIPKEWYSVMCSGIHNNLIDSYAQATKYYSDNQDKFKVKTIMVAKHWDGSGRYQVFIANDVKPGYENLPNIELNKIDTNWHTIVLQ